MLLLLGAASPFDASGYAALVTALTSAVLGALAYAAGRKKDKQVVVEVPTEQDDSLSDEWRKLVTNLKQELETVRAERDECKRRLARYEGVDNDRERSPGRAKARRQD